MRDNGSTSVNSVFSPAIADNSDPNHPYAFNERCYSARANLTLDWRCLGEEGNTSLVDTWNSPWVQTLLGDCVLSQVERGRMTIMTSRLNAVGRVGISQGGMADGVYDLMYIRVDPEDGGGVFPSAGHWDALRINSAGAR